MSFIITSSEFYGNAIMTNTITYLKVSGDMKTIQILISEIF